MLKFADNSFVTNPGSSVKQKYAPHVDPDGTITLVEDGIEDWQEYINSFKESSEISSVVARFIDTNDPSVLNVKEGMYGDFTKFPKTYAEALQLKIDADRMYDSLPVEFKEKFDSDRNKFFALSGTPEWYENLTGLIENPYEVIKEPVEEVKE